MTIAEELLPKSGPKGGPVDNSQVHDEHPTRLADIPEPKTTDRCSRCGKPGVMKFNCTVKPNERFGKALLTRTYSICERCASFLVYEVDKVFER